MAKNEDHEGKKPVGNAFGHYRRPVANLKRIGEEVLHDGKSNDTVGDLRKEYPVLLKEVGELEQYVRIKTKRATLPTADEVIADFQGNGILVGDGKVGGYEGYATRQDIAEYLQSDASNFKFARDLIAKAWNLKRSTVDTYLKPTRSKRKK